LAGFAQQFLFAWAVVPVNANRKTTNTTPAILCMIDPRESNSKNGYPAGASS
jgi:hypothetical protein